MYTAFVCTAKGQGLQKAVFNTCIEGYILFSDKIKIPRTVNLLVQCKSLGDLLKLSVTKFRSSLKFPNTSVLCEVLLPSGIT